MPVTIRNITTPKEIRIVVPGADVPSRAQRKPSMTPVIGFRAYNHCQDWGIILAGYTTGDANIQICIRNGTVYWKSRYWTFKADSQRPTESEVIMAKIISSGRNMTLIVGTTP